MTRRLRNRLIELSMLVLLAAAGAAVMPRAHAGMIATDETQAPTVQAERERLKVLLARPEVAKQLGNFGVKPEDASARVDAMTDAEVLSLAGKVDQLIAAGALSNDQLIVILLLVVLLVLLL
jgi:tripartite-type tricarboxylate transporter receptor subunit TctC